MSILLVFVIIFVLAYAFLSGFSDASNAVSTAIGVRALQPKTALILAAIFDTIGALSGTAVALTITQGLVDVTSLTLVYVIVVVLTSTLWSIGMYIFGIPVSETHGLIGAIIGAAMAIGGPGIIIWSGLVPTLIAIFASPILGFIAAYAALKGVRWAIRNWTPKQATKTFKPLLILSMCLAAYSHGHNDAQKPMGIIAMALVISGVIATPFVPFWVVVSVAAAVGIGVYLGGVRIIRTIGFKLTKLSLDQGTVAQLSATVVLEAASATGVPVSTTQILTSAVAGSAYAKRKNSLNYKVFSEILISWLVTLPATMILGYILGFIVL